MYHIIITPSAPKTGIVFMLLSFMLSAGNTNFLSYIVLCFNYQVITILINQIKKKKK